MSRRHSLALLAALTMVVSAASGLTTSAVADERPFDPVDARYEVWTIYQTDSRAGYGGFLHIYDGAALETDAVTAAAERIDLGGAASDVCLSRTGALPVRPHMVVFNGGDGHVPGGGRYAAVSWW